MEMVAFQMKEISCRDLSLGFSLLGEPPIYAVVSLVNVSGPPQSHSTQFSRNDGRNPNWDQELQFTLPVKVKYNSSCPIFLQLEFRSRRGLGGVLGDAVVGKAGVLLRSLLEEYDAEFGGPGDRFRSTAFQVQSPGGKPAGEVRFLYRIRSQKEFKGTESPVSSHPPLPASNSEDSYTHHQPYAAPKHNFFYPPSVPPPATVWPGYPAENYSYGWSAPSWSAPPVAGPSYVRDGYQWFAGGWGVDGRAHPPHTYG